MYASDNGASVYYEEYGSGDPLVLLPSFGLTTFTYRILAEKLSRKYYVIVPDLHRGFSRKAGVVRSMSEYADSLHRFLEELKIRNFVLVGVSHSSLISAQYQFKYPERVKSVIHISPIAPIEGTKLERITIFGAVKGFFYLFLYNLFSASGWKLNAILLYDVIFRYAFRHPLQLLHDMRMGVACYKYMPAKKSRQVLLADRDEFTGPWSRDEIPQKLPENVEVKIVKGTHMWFVRENGDIVNTVINGKGTTDPASLL